MNNRLSDALWVYLLTGGYMAIFAWLSYAMLFDSKLAAFTPVAMEPKQAFAALFSFFFIHILVFGLVMAAKADWSKT